MIEKAPKTIFGGYSVDELSKLLGVAAVLAYVVGYLVLSYYLSSFGVALQSPFRPRILEAGISTATLFAFPIAIGTAVAFMPGRNAHKGYVMVLRLLLIPIGCASIVATPGFLGTVPSLLSLSNDIASSPRSKSYIGLVFAMGLLAIFPLVWAVPRAFEWIWKHFEKRRFLSVVILSSITSLFVMIGFDFSRNSVQGRFFCWFLAVATTTCVLIGSDGDRHYAKERQRAREEALSLLREVDGVEAQLGKPRDSTVLVKAEEQNLEELATRVQASRERLEAHLANIESGTHILGLKRSAMIFAPVSFFFMLSTMGLAVFTNEIYPYVPFKYGGGERTEITIYGDKTPNLRSGLSADLLDENEDGVLIILPGEKRGSFIPKEQIETIYYGPKGNRGAF